MGHRKMYALLDSLAKLSRLKIIAKYIKGVRSTTKNLCCLGISFILVTRCVLNFFPLGCRVPLRYKDSKKNDTEKSEVLKSHTYRGTYVSYIEGNKRYHKSRSQTRALPAKTKPSLFLALNKDLIYSCPDTI